MVRKLSAASLALVGGSWAHSALADWEVNMPRGVTEISEEIYGLHMLIFGICVAIAVIVFGAMIYSIFAHRKSLGVKPATFSHSTKAEIVWTVIPILILVGMAVPAAETMVRLEDSRNSDLTVKVTGYQWKWRYDYIDDGFGFFSSLAESSDLARQLGSGIDPETVENYLLEVDNPLVVPVDAKVRVLITAADVIHAWWVPELGGKKDAVPGFVNEMWFQAREPGVYRGQCAELCGRDHGFMPIVVNVLPRDEYDAWLSDQTAGLEFEQAVMTTETTAAAMPAAAMPAAAMPAAAAPTAGAEAGGEGADWSMATAMAEGETLYKTHCGACHQPDGTGMPPAFPAIAGSPVATGDIVEHIAVGLNGRPGTAMAGFGAMLDDEQLAAIITYQRNAWGNDTGDLVSPADVAAAR
jgi:cytochrome c oxidase subunit 2